MVKTDADLLIEIKVRAVLNNKRQNDLPEEAIRDL